MPGVLLRFSVTICRETAVGPEEVLPEKELNRITAQWESIYGNYLLWNDKTNAAFVGGNGTQSDVPYVIYKTSPCAGRRCLIFRQEWPQRQGP